MTGGGYLSFFFVISHNFEGAQALSDTTRPSNKGCEKNSFLYKQVTLEQYTQTAKMIILIILKVAASSNVGGWWLCQLNGGLNYQIEHHLFPRMNHCHYPTIAPIVRWEVNKSGFCSHFSWLTTMQNAGNSAWRGTFPTGTSLHWQTMSWALWHTSLTWATTQTLIWGSKWSNLCG